MLYDILSVVDWGNRIHYKTFVCLGSASRGMVRGGASSVPCLELAAYLGDEWFVIREGSLHNDAIHCVNILCIAAYGYKDSPMYAQIENCVQLAIIV
jgi:hypothetical protein